MPANGTHENQELRDIEARYQARLEAEVARLRTESRRTVEEFKRSFPPPSEEQIERLLVPELSEIHFHLGGRKFALRELPALAEKQFLRLVEQKLPAILQEVLSFDQRLGEDAGVVFASVLARAGSALDLVSDAAVLVLDPEGESGLTREFVQQHASTAFQIRILRAQMMLNGARDFLSRLFPALSATQEGPARSVSNDNGQPRPQNKRIETHASTPSSPPSPVGVNSSARHPA